MGTSYLEMKDASPLPWKVPFKCWGHVVWYGPEMKAGGVGPYLLPSLSWKSRLHEWIGVFLIFLGRSHTGIFSYRNSTHYLQGICPFKALEMDNFFYLDMKSGWQVKRGTVSMFPLLNHRNDTSLRKQMWGWQSTWKVPCFHVYEGRSLIPTLLIGILLESGSLF